MDKQSKLSEQANCRQTADWLISTVHDPYPAKYDVPRHPALYSSLHNRVPTVLASGLTFSFEPFKT